MNPHRAIVVIDLEQDAFAFGFEDRAIMLAVRIIFGIEGAESTHLFENALALGRGGCALSAHREQRARRLLHELGRSCVLGKPPRELIEELEFVRRAQKMCLELMTPGTPSSEIWESYNAFLAEHGRPRERRLHAHGQGYDLVERPLIRFDEPMAIQERMSITAHPSYIKEGLQSWICDNYLIGPGGPGNLSIASRRRSSRFETSARRRRAYLDSSAAEVCVGGGPPLSTSVIRAQVCSSALAIVASLPS